MKQWQFYRVALKLMPPVARHFEASRSYDREKSLKLNEILREHRTVGATVVLFNEYGSTNVFCYGLARRKGCVPAAAETVYRTASISKLVTAYGVMRLVQEGKISLDEDLEGLLPVSLRHPAAPHVPITLRMLLSHTAGICDGPSYIQSLRENLPLSLVLTENCHTIHTPGTRWEYSNLGAGLVGCVLEAVSGASFNTLMQQTVFSPLGIEASFYPQQTGNNLADAYRILPPHIKPCFNAVERRERLMPEDIPDPQTHYALAHGNLCISAPALAKIGAALLSEEYAQMRKSIVPFGERAGNLSQGLGTFVLRDNSICSQTLYGHQGAAYGAIHGLFFDPLIKRGVVLLTSGASEAREGVLADINRDMLKWAFGG